MVYKAHELLGLLNNLQLTGVEDGRLQWMGSKSDWARADGATAEEMNEDELAQAEEYFWSHLAKNNEDEKGRDEFLARELNK